MSEKYLVDLTAAEHEDLGGLLKHGKASARKIARAHMLLHAAEGLSDEEIADMLRVGRSTIEGAWRRVARARAQVPRSAARRVPVSGWLA